jgi:hypothetical protein
MPRNDSPSALPAWYRVGQRNAGLRKADCWNCDKHAYRSGGLHRFILDLTSVSTTAKASLVRSDHNRKQYEVGRNRGQGSSNVYLAKAATNASRGSNHRTGKQMGYTNQSRKKRRKELRARC